MNFQFSHFLTSPKLRCLFCSYSMFAAGCRPPYFPNTSHFTSCVQLIATNTFHHYVNQLHTTAPLDFSLLYPQTVRFAVPVSTPVLFWATLRPSVDSSTNRTHCLSLWSGFELPCFISSSSSPTHLSLPPDILRRTNSEIFRTESLMALFSHLSIRFFRSLIQILFLCVCVCVYVWAPDHHLPNLCSP